MGISMTVSDDGGSVIGNALINELELPNDGLYLVFATFADYILFTARVLEQNEFGMMNYEIILDGATPPDANTDTILQLNAEKLDLGQSAMLEISKNTPMAFIVFFAQQADIITITTSPGETPMDTMLYLFNTMGEAIEFNDDGENTAAFYSSIDALTVIDEGMHLVIATSYQFYDALEDDWENTGIFHLSVNP